MLFYSTGPKRRARLPLAQGLSVKLIKISITIIIIISSSSSSSSSICCYY